MIKLAICKKYCDRRLKFVVAKFFENVTINTKFHNSANFQATAEFCTNLEMAHQAEFNGIDNCCLKWVIGLNFYKIDWEMLQIYQELLLIRPKYLLGTLKVVLIGCVKNQGRYPNFWSKNYSKNFAKFGQAKFGQKCCKVRPKNCCKVRPGKYFS